MSISKGTKGTSIILIPYFYSKDNETRGIVRQLKTSVYKSVNIKFCIKVF